MRGGGGSRGANHPSDQLSLCALPRAGSRSASRGALAGEEDREDRITCNQITTASNDDPPIRYKLALTNEEEKLFRLPGCNYRDTCGHPRPPPPTPPSPADLGPGHILSSDFYRKMLLRPALRGRGLTGSPRPSPGIRTADPGSLITSRDEGTCEGRWRSALRVNWVLG